VSAIAQVTRADAAAERRDRRLYPEPTRQGPRALPFCR
jgi:ribosomal protein S21